MNTDIPVRYFICLPKKNLVRYSLYNKRLSGGYATFQGSASDFVETNVAIAIPVPIELALSIGWVQPHEIVESFDLPLPIRAAFRVLGDAV